MTTQSTDASVPWRGICCALLIILCSTCFAKTITNVGFSLIGSKKECKISFTLINNLIVVPITLNNGYTTKAVVDTGVRSVVLYGSQHRKSMNFINSRNVKINGLGKGSRQSGKLSVNNMLQIGQVRGEGVAIVCVDSNIPFESLNRQGVEAILGYQLFSNFIIEIDYQNKKITFKDPIRFTPDPDVDRFDLELIDTKPYINTSLKINNEHSTIQANNMKVLLDTGASIDMLIYNKSKNVNLFMINSNKVTIGQGMNGNISGTVTEKMKMDIGQLRLEAVVVSISDRQSSRKHSKHFGVDGLIGGNILKQYKVTFDYINGAVYLESPNAEIKSASL